MSQRALLALLVGAALLLSGCTQAPPAAPATPSTPRVTTAPITPAPAATPVAATPALPGTTSGGSAQALGESIVGCMAGTPWEYTSPAATTPAGYLVTYTIHGKTSYKGGDYCRVSGKVEAAGPGAPAAYLPAFDYYFKVDPTGAAYSDIWYSYTIAGQTQEVHVVAGAGGAAVSGAATPAGTPAPGAATPAAGSAFPGIAPKPTAAGAECPKLLTAADINQVWSRSDWFLAKEETKPNTPGAHRDDPAAYGSGVKVIDETILTCKYVDDLYSGSPRSLTARIHRFPAASRYTAEFHANAYCSAIAVGGATQPIEGLGGSCISSAALLSAAVKGNNVWFEAECNGCTQPQLAGLAKLISSRL